MDNNLERPCLSCDPCSEKLPIVLSSEGVKPIIQVPASIAQFLRDYQRDGVRFLYQRFKDGEGGILGDDMGLGKTVQAIAFTAAVLLMKGSKEDKLRHCSDYVRLDSAPNVEVPSVSPVLIICPASLVENWHEELTTWGFFKCFKMTAQNRSDLVARAKLNQYDVLIVSHDTARLSIEYLNTVDWTCVFVDEVHRIKDSQSKLTMALNSLTCTLRFGLTGTPFQNNLKEVYCLLKWSNPQSVDDFDSNMISRLMEKGLRSSATKKETTDSLRARGRFREVRNKFILRRTKEILVKHLPSKTDQVVFCKPTEIQKNIYRMIIQSPVIQNFLHGTKKAGREQNRLIFTALNLLHKAANHVGLLAMGLSAEKNEVSYKICCQVLKQFANLENVPQKRWIDALSDNFMSGKMLVLSKLLPEFLEKNDKILIFSYSTKLLDLIEKHIVKERYTYCRLDGSTPVDARCAMVRLYNTSPHPAIFLISTKAGGVGLNITGANVVVIFDPNWNPACDLQAQDRAYRLGQQRDVRIYRLLTTSTIEEFVYLRQVYKQQLGSSSMTDKNSRRYFNSIQGDPKYYGELFGVKNLFSFRETDRSLTEELLQKNKQQGEKLLLKLKGKLGKEIENAFISECPIAANKSGIISAKSGLSELCEEVFGVHDFDNFLDTAMHEEILDGHQGTSNRDESTVLERTGGVRHVFKHKDIVGPSVVEDFVSDCAIRDMLKKKKNSHLLAFDCSIGTQEPIAEIAARSSTAIRMKFNKIAEKEHLSEYQLALRVLSLNEEEKSAFLKKYQKRQQPETGDSVYASKRSRVLYSTTELPGSENTQTSPRNMFLDKPVSSCLANVSREENMLIDDLFNSNDAKESSSKSPSEHSSVLNRSCSSNPSSNPSSAAGAKEILCHKSKIIDIPVSSSLAYARKENIMSKDGCFNFTDAKGSSSKKPSEHSFVQNMPSSAAGAKEIVCHKSKIIDIVPVSSCLANVSKGETIPLDDCFNSTDAKGSSSKKPSEHSSVQNRPCSSNSSPAVVVKETMCHKSKIDKPDSFSAISISREATTLVNDLFFKKTCNAKDSASKRPSGHSPVKSGPCSLNPSSAVIDQATGCSLEALSVLDSLFFSKNSSPKKNCTNFRASKHGPTNFQPPHFSSDTFSILNNSLLKDIFND